MQFKDFGKYMYGIKNLNYKTTNFKLIEVPTFGRQKHTKHFFTIAVTNMTSRFYLSSLIRMCTVLEIKHRFSGWDLKLID